MSRVQWPRVQTLLVTSVESPAFTAAREHRRALIAEAEGIDWDERHPGWRARYEAFYRAAFSRGDAVLISCGDRDAYAGSCIASILNDFRRAVAHDGIGYVNGLYVRPIFRRQHVGTALIGTALEWFAANDCPVVRLHPSPGSIPFYRRLGFAPIQEFELRNERA